MNHNIYARRKASGKSTNDASASALGNTTNLRTPLSQGVEKEASQGRRSRRYSLQRQAQYLLREKKRMSKTGKEVPLRVELCMVASKSGNGVQVVKTTEGAK